jgi:hypothetical protein
MEEKNKYTLKFFKENRGPEDSTQEIVFYKLNEDGTYENGTTVEDLIRVAIERLKDLGLKFPSRENSVAITKLEEANMWLEARTKDRINRGVEGKHLA